MVKNKACQMNHSTWPPADADQEVGTMHERHHLREFQYDVQWPPDQSKSLGTGADEHWSESRSPAYQSDDEPSSVSPGSVATNPCGKKQNMAYYSISLSKAKGSES